MGKKVLIGMQMFATVLFIANYQTVVSPHWASWVVPLVLLLMVAINSVWFTRFVSWLIFSTAFFALLVCLSAFTLRWRLEPGFSAVPFYRAILLYTALIYISLGQIKILGGNAHATSK